MLSVQMRGGRVQPQDPGEDAVLQQQVVPRFRLGSRGRAPSKPLRDPVRRAGVRPGLESRTEGDRTLGLAVA